MSIYHWHWLANGYSGNAPNDYVRFLNQMRTFPNDSSLEALRAKHVRWIVIHQALLEPAVFVESDGAIARRTRPAIDRYLRRSLGAGDRAGAFTDKSVRHAQKVSASFVHRWLLGRENRPKSA